MKGKNHKTAVTPDQSISHHYSHAWIFQHKELLAAINTNRSWEQKKLINKLNYLNFIDGYIFALFRHKENAEYLLIKVYPQPCIKDELICRLDLSDSLIDLTKHSLDYLMIDDGLAAILAPVELLSIKNNTLRVKLPDKSYLVTKHKTKRHNCSGVTCEMTQGDFNSMGELADFTPSGMGIKLTENENIKKFNKNKPILINLTRNGINLFSGFCQCIRDGTDSPDGRIVFAPINKQVARFPKRRIRNPRQQIVPSFTINFKHPFSRVNVERDVLEISTSGFSVRDTIEEEILLPGMIIPKLSIVYAGIVRMDCSAQVVYRQEDRENNIVQCGLAITDMDVTPYSHFNHILGTHLDDNARVSTEVDMDELWEFFFDTGFLYGEKYKYLQPYRETFKETYRKLYQDNPDIARYCVYEKNGKIYGHMSMVHAYNPSWLIHHFAARPMEGKIASLKILRQITHYINGFYRFPSGGMDYVMAYYQPGNNVMSTIFGGFADHIGDRKICSLDLFSYLRFETAGDGDKDLPANWLLRESISSDYMKFENFYEGHSSGLLYDALNINTPMDNLKKSFFKAGLERNCQAFSLCFKEDQVAFFIVDQSDLGLNLSDLLNSIKIIIIDEAELKWDILKSTVNRIIHFYREKYVPVLIYPSDYPSRHGISIEKQYDLWALKISTSSDQYHEYMKNKFRIRYRTE